tara:strand:- start:303 stop:626 length:324 start_codon:yes stop_codon:yes gene_type:complete
MIKNKLTILIIILFSCLLFSCQTAKEALEGKKRSEQSDEFLVEKKNPLALPPDYEKLPTPGNENVSPETFSENNEVKDLLNIEDSGLNTNDNDSSADIESSIIEKIQ